MTLPIIDRETLKLALTDLLSTDVETTADDLRDLRRILANLPGNEVRAEFDAALQRKLTETTPKFRPGDRCFSHYVGDWGTVEEVQNTTRGDRHGVTGKPLPDSTWYYVRMDKSNRRELLDDAHGDWDMARIVPPEVARRFGWGTDPEATA